MAIDVETANADLSSICSIGAAVFEEGHLRDEMYVLVDPRSPFDALNVSIHGIDAERVRGAPPFCDILPALQSLVADKIAVIHTAFDKASLHRAATRWDVTMPKWRWLDTARVARRTWEDCAKSGYGLAPLCQRIGYTFQHHHALEDAKAAGQILLAAMRHSGLDLQAIFDRAERPLSVLKPSSAAAVCREGNPEGPLFGEVVVFTGALQTPRREAADIAARLGCQVDGGVTKNTTLLVVGDQDVLRLAGHEKSSKHRKAEELAAKGQPIRILREADFRELLGDGPSGLN